MTRAQAWRLSYGLDPVAWLALADWMEEHLPYPVASFVAPVWRRRARIAIPFLAWLRAWPSSAFTERIDLLPDTWLIQKGHPRTIRCVLWRCTGAGLTDPEPAPPGLIFPRTHIQDHSAHRHYWRQRLFALADRLTPSETTP